MCAENGGEFPAVMYVVFEHMPDNILERIFFKIQGGFANMSPIEYSYCMGSLQELGIDLDSITDPKIKKAIVLLFNLIEDLSSENTTLREENQKLRNEIALLKGEK